MLKRLSKTLVARGKHNTFTLKISWKLQLIPDCSTQTEEKREEINIDEGDTERGPLLSISDTKATSTVSESRGIAPFGQLAGEQQAARADPTAPLPPFALACHEWDNESVRLHANDSDVVFVSNVTIPFANFPRLVDRMRLTLRFRDVANGESIRFYSF